ncbi:hypothetical protein RN001_014973 [Aquatica leii]|uniref:Anti-proliferative protein domain-containing protein n=1 Tax=Aquatica leii TaxID=1421715 RepID=A0AAN7PP18_9COLE|nr:hypothetical protein RN001_014973 [Aquatica leii]
MKEEVLAAVMFLIRFIEKSERFPSDQIENFKTHLTTLLMQRFEKHWFPEIPAKGQGYRCIRLNVLSPVDQSLEKAASRCGLSYRDLSLPTELTVWVDPSEVCYRLGESEGSYCTLATFPSESSSSSESSNSSSPLPSPPTTPTQEKSRRTQLMRHQRIPVDGTIKNRNFSFTSSNAVASLRSKPLSREMSFNYQNRPPWRCDSAPFPLPPAIYRTYNNSYNTRQYKNVVKV